MESINNGDIVAYEFADPQGEWLWSVGRVLALTHPRVMTLEMWVPQKKKNISNEEKKKASATMEKIANKQKQLGEERAEIQRLVSELTVKSQEVQSRMDECETELADVLPILEEAKRALSGVSVKELREVKGYSQPPTVVKLVMEAVLTVIGEGKKASDWDFVKQRVTDTGFMTRVKYFDPIEMSPETVKKVTRISEHPDFNFDRAQRASKAAGPLQKWVDAQLAYMAAVPDHLKPLLEQARLLKHELRQVEDSKLDNEARVSQIEAEVRKLLQQYNDLLHGEGVKVNYDKDGLPCLTREIPGGAWTPAEQRKVAVVRSSALCILATPGRMACTEYVFDKEAAESVRSAVNVNGQTIIKAIPKGAFNHAASAAVAATKLGAVAAAARTQSPQVAQAGRAGNRKPSAGGGSRRQSSSRSGTPRTPTPPPIPPPTGSTTSKKKEKEKTAKHKEHSGGRNVNTAQTTAEKKHKHKHKNVDPSSRGTTSSAQQPSLDTSGTGGSKDGIPAPPPLLQPLHHKKSLGASDNTTSLPMVSSGRKQSSGVPGNREDDDPMLSSASPGAKARLSASNALAPSSGRRSRSGERDADDPVIPQPPANSNKRTTLPALTPRGGGGES